LGLLVPDAEENLQPYEIMPLPVDRQPIYRCKYPQDTKFAYQFEPKVATIADKLRYARITAELEQAELAEKVGIDRVTLTRLENGQVSDKYMRTSTLVKIAVACGRGPDFCCDEYHAFMAGDYGAEIRQMRKSQGWTQNRLAGLMGVNVTTVKRWERQVSQPSREHYGELMRLVREEYM
jgi:transcriptional regulator with XRE-family HTH domain